MIDKRSRIKLIALISPLLIAPVNFVVAEENFLSDDLSFVVSASRLTQSVRNSPSAVTVIDKAMIAASGFTDIVDLFRLVPGFQVAHVNGTRKTVVYHGSGWEYPNRLQVLVNGRSTHLPTLSTVDWNSIGVHIKDIDRIEVVRGPSASAYGSNSFSAAINIITISPELDHNYQFQALTGTHGQREVVFRTSERGTNHSYRFTGSYQQDSGFDNNLDSKKFKSLSFHGRFNATPMDTLDVNFNKTLGSADVEQYDYIKPTDRSISAWSGSLKWQKIISPQQELTFNLSHTSHDEDDISETYLLSDILGVTPFLFQFLTGIPDHSLPVSLQTNYSRKTDLEIQYNHSKENGIQYVLGAGYTLESLSSPAFFPNKGKVTDEPYRFFANGEFPLTDTLVANAGIIYENSPDTRAYWSPRLSLNWHFKPAHSLRFAVSKAHRIPSILEREADVTTVLSDGTVIDYVISSSSSLSAEKIISYEIGYTGQHREQPLSWELKAYKEKITDTIISVSDHTVIDYIDNKTKIITNGGDYTTYGIEGEITYKPAADSFVRFHFNRGKGEDKSQDQGQIHLTTPKQSYGFLASHKLFDWQFNLGLYHVGSMLWLSQGSHVDSYTRLDAGIAKSIKLSQSQILNIKLGAQNINNKYYEFNNSLATTPKYYIALDLSEF